MKIVGKTLMNQAGNVSLACLQKTYNLYQSQKIKLFSYKFSVFIYVGILNFYASVSGIRVSMVTAMYRTFIVNNISIHGLILTWSIYIIHIRINNISAMHALDTMSHVI